MDEHIERAAFWRRHYEGRHALAGATGAARLDYSNDRVQVQTYAHVLDAVGSVAGRNCLDAGCGLGTIALALHGVGGQVVAVDLIAATISRLREDYPFVQWRAVDLGKSDEIAALPVSDVVTCVEVLQHLAFGPALRSLWDRVAPGGRLVISVPNAACPIVARAASQQGEHWTAIDWDDIREQADRLPGLRRLKVKPLYFADDQDVAPYVAGPWSDDVPGVPNRLVCVFLRH